MEVTVAEDGGHLLSPPPPPLLKWQRNYGLAWLCIVLRFR